jgi:hypothetical protein
MKLTKSQLQFFFDEVLGEFGWCDEIEETEVDPIDFIRDEVSILRRSIKRTEEIAIESKRIIEQFQKLLCVHTATEGFAKIVVIMREESEIEVELNKYKNLVNAIYEVVSVECNDVGETFSGIQNDIEELRRGLTPRAADAIEPRH